MSSLVLIFGASKKSENDISQLNTFQSSTHLILLITQLTMTYPTSAHHDTSQLESIVPLLLKMTSKCEITPPWMTTDQYSQ